MNNNTEAQSPASEILLCYTFSIFGGISLAPLRLRKQFPSFKGANRKAVNKTFCFV